ncbi:MAG: hypothetical protein K0Q51_1386 [Rickettsiaceae bacterium]|jgi:DNA-binding CsgD family transcriptional regulator|nr:hypothetical protein [Rickettsiaceae bacterium]
MITKDQLGIQALLAEEICPAINPILDNMYVKTFGYRVFRNDGKSFGFCTNFEWTKFFELNLADQVANHYEKELESIIKDNKQYILRLGSPNSESKLLSALYHFDLWNSIGIHQKNEDNIEAFYFVSSVKTPDILEHYINNIQLLKQFTAFFKDKINLVLKEKSEAPIFREMIPSNILSSSLQPEGLEKSLQEQLERKKFSVSINNRVISFSKREIECLKLLAKGQTLKHIAANLNISPRTAEHHINNIKYKSDIHDRCNLIDFYYNKCDKIMNFSL